jgi:hypothetical protein
MLLKLLQDRIVDLLEALVQSFFNTILSALFFFTRAPDDNVARHFVLSCSYFTVDLIVRIRTLLMIDSALGDIHPLDVLPRGHSLEPRTHMTIQQFTSDDGSMLATGFRAFGMN